MFTHIYSSFYFQESSPSARSCDVVTALNRPGVLFITGCTYKMFSARTTLQDLKDHTGPLDPPTDLLNVKKETLLRYISHLMSKLDGKDEAIEKISETFKQSISDIMEKNNTSVAEDMKTIKESIAKLSSGPKPVSLPSGRAPECVPKPQVAINPYDELTKDLLGETQEQTLRKSLEEMDYIEINNQREVAYMGEYKYKYTGGTHDPAPIPEPVQGLIEKVLEKYPGYTVSSCMSSRYKDGTNFCPPHSDDERTIGPESLIFTYSMGQERPIEFTRIDPIGEEDKVTLSLPNNSLLAFSRQSQAYWRHAIPTTDASGTRYSLTLRLIKPHFLNSTIIYGDSNTKYLKFGNGEGTFGRWMPGKRVKTQRVSDLPDIKDIYPYQNIVIHVGINDVNRSDRLSTSEYLDKLKVKCNEIHSIYPATRVILSPLLPTKRHQLNVQIWEINNGIVKLSKTHHNIILMDNSIFAVNNDTLNSEYSCYNNPQDYIHLGKTGIKVLAESIKSYVLRKNSFISKSLNYISAHEHGHRT